MSQFTLILLIILFVMILIYVVHLYDKYLVSEINKYEKSLLWALKEKTGEEQRILNSIFFSHRMLKRLNYNETFMTCYNYFKIILAPIYGILSPVVFIIVPFIYLRYFTGLNVSFSEYWSIFR